MGKIFRFAKKYIPNPVKSRIKKTLGIPAHVRLGEDPPYLGKAHCGKDTKGPLRIAVHRGGGLGDYIVSIPIIDQLMSLCECTIDIYNDNIMYCSALYGPRANVNLISWHCRPADEESYDLILDTSHCFIIRHANYSIRKKAPALYAALEKIQKFNNVYAVHLDNCKMPSLALRQAEFLYMNYWDFLSGGGAFAMRDQRSAVFIDMNRFDFAEQYEAREYIVVSRGADIRNGGCRQTKVWPREKYEDCVAIIKARFPDIRIIQIVTNGDSEIAGVDDVIRDADMEDLKVVVKNAAACVASEGGIGHLAAQMSTPAVVVFGPTPVLYYGYRRNVNIVSPFCSGCMAVTPDWYTLCPRGFTRAKCMEAISGEMVADAVFGILESRKTYRFSLEHFGIYSSREFNEFKTALKSIARKNRMDAGCGNGHISGPDGTYIHSTKRWEYPYIAERISAHGTRLKIADVGAGRGALSLYLAGLGHDVTVYDMDYNWDNNGDSQAHNRFMRHCAENRVKAKIASGFNLPEDEGSFDAVISASVLEHVMHKKYLLRELLRVLKPGGILIMTYDLAESGANNRLKNTAQIEVMTPFILRGLLSGIGIEADLYQGGAIAESRKEAHADAIDLHPSITAGGCVIKKHFMGS